MAAAPHDVGPEQEAGEAACGQSSVSRSRHRAQNTKTGSRSHFARPRALLPPSQRARPTHFVAIHLKSREIQRCVEQLQQWFVAQDKLFERCLVPIKRLHTALLLTSFEEPRISEARQVCAEAARSIREFLGGESVQLKAKGIGSFGGRVVFARVRTEPPELLQAMHDLLCRIFMRHNFPILDDTGQAWLTPGEEPRQFSGHASFLKVTKAMARSRTEAERKSFRSLHVSDEDIAKWNSTSLGTQVCDGIELLSIVGMAHDGYYPRIKVEKLPGADVMQSASSMCQAGDQPLMTPEDAVEEAWRSRPLPWEDFQRVAVTCEVCQADPAAQDVKRRLGRLGPDIWQVVSQVLTIQDLLCMAAVAKETLSIVQSVVCKARVMLFSETAHASSCLDGSCLDWDRNRVEGNQCPPLQIRWLEDFLSQPAGGLLYADIGFVEDSQQLIFGRSLEGLHTALREALPIAFGDLNVEVEAVRNISSPTKPVLETLRAAQPEIVGIEGLAVHDLPAWVNCVQQLARARVLVHAWTNRDVDNAAYFCKLLQALPPLVRGLDFQNLACTFLDFPISSLPKACIAFGTIVLQKDVRGCSARGSMDFGDFISTFPRFPTHVRVVRASLGTEGHWAFSAKEIADVFRAKFPGLVVLQLELSLRHSAATNDVPFIDLARALIEADVRVEVTSIRCRPQQYEFLRAALTHAGAAVQQVEDEYDQTAFPFSHPRFDWSKVVNSC